VFPQPHCSSGEDCLAERVRTAFSDSVWVGEAAIKPNGSMFWLYECSVPVLTLN